jgi:hypothetical protein
MTERLKGIIDMKRILLHTLVKYILYILCNGLKIECTTHNMLK